MLVPELDVVAVAKIPFFDKKKFPKTIFKIKYSTIVILTDELKLSACCKSSVKINFNKF